MLGTIVNTIAVITGAIIGIILKKGLKPQMADTLMKGLGLCTLFIGISGSLRGENTLLMIVAIVLGIIVGEAIDLEDKLNRLGNRLEERFKSKSNHDLILGERGKAGDPVSEAGFGETSLQDAPPDRQISIAEGFVTASLLFCVGALAIVGSLQSGLTGNHEILFNKSILDFVAAAIFASTLGIGVMFSAGLVLLYQGTITLFSQWLAPYLTDIVIAEMTCIGSVILIGLALNMLKITKLRIMNFVPAIFMPILLHPLFALLW